MDFKVSKLEELPAVAASLVKNFPSERLFFFFGEMGAGKTTFIKELCSVLGVKDEVSSPTYSIVNEYYSDKGKVYHFDFYRLKTETEALDMGYEEYFYEGSYCLVEWPEKIKSLWPSQYVRVDLSVGDDDERLLLAVIVK
ncbi:tRNA (adenosine(37)-N6)-threonylcarbamoyltransferase complex ATPase subunit type 1 TsaE [Flavihumibacter sp. R14]|nr:tRNA (adenosine(37)-N6)-threonylcarbamoyltransferase complex ATPase subunit type 1 TsaE [Flavihumibacter soli]